MLRLGPTELYFETTGSGQPILGIHGTPSSAVLWEDAAVELGRVGQCIVYDRRGFHRSGGLEPGGTLDLAQHVADAVALLDSQATGPAVVIGRSTGGLVALGLAHAFPGRVRALVLLEPAVFSVDDDALAWAGELRRRVLAAAANDPGAAAEAVIREALGGEVWDTLPDGLRRMFAATGPAVLAEIRGQGLDLSDSPPALSEEALRQIRQPTLLVSAEDSPAALRRVNERLAALLPASESVLVPGGHLIDPAHRAVLAFVRSRLEEPGGP